MPICLERRTVVTASTFELRASIGRYRLQIKQGRTIGLDRYE